MTASPSELKAEAMQTGSFVFYDGLQVSPEGQYFICGRRCTLNEAIIYLGNRTVTRAKRAASA